MERSLPLVFHVPVQADGMRLDAALKWRLPGLGLRARRRLWEWCRVSVNGHAQRPGHVVAVGDEVRLEQFIGEAGGESGSPPAIPLLTLGRNLAAFAKPEGLHSAKIPGSRTPSFEEHLRHLWPTLWSDWLSAQKNTPPPGRCLPPLPKLLTRLDQATSGLVLGAVHPAAAADFRAAERQGLVEKNYFAVVRGELEQSLALTWRLDTASRAKTLVKDEEDPDSARHTLVVPITALNTFRILGLREPPPGIPAQSTLVRALIKRGARHQIRAHLSKAGFPLLGEWLYAPDINTECRLYLHHARVELPGFSAEHDPQWFSEPGFEAFSQETLRKR